MQFMSLSEEIQVASHTFSLVNFSNHSESMYTDRVKEPHFIGEISKSIENQVVPAVSFEQKPILYRSKSHYHSTSLKSLKDDSGGDSGGDEEEKDEGKNDN